MKNKLLALILLFPFFSLAQTAQSVVNPVEGKWKVIAINNGVIVDFKTNKEVITPELKESLRGRPDSAHGIEMFRMMAKKYNNYYFVFRKDWIYQEIMDGQIRSDTSVYSIEENERNIYMRKASNTQDAMQAMNYDVRKDGILELSIYVRDRKMTLELEKVKED